MLSNLTATLDAILASVILESLATNLLDSVESAIPEAVLESAIPKAVLGTDISLVAVGKIGAVSELS